jgi:lipopolysaccharide/colanic/teichoic acid biosynthesis glycosyltransferase
MITRRQIKTKRAFDIILSIILLCSLFLLIFTIVLITALSFWSSGVFVQERIGQHGKPFNIYKIQTIKNDNLNIWTSFLRKTKLDELPQLFNIIKGDMSFVGPRPDIPGYADLLIGEDRNILLVKPGITGPASIHFKNEEEILKVQSNPKKYNDEVIWQKKVSINLIYVKSYSFKKDLFFLLKTII